tara:strand:+ start:441 stop:602 length:162 start_codon:yes stop_codon:yes gene_type:complete
MERTGQLQFDITNDKKRRLDAHAPRVGDKLYIMENLKLQVLMTDIWFFRSRRN